MSKHFEFSPAECCWTNGTEWFDSCGYDNGIPAYALHVGDIAYIFHGDSMDKDADVIERAEKLLAIVKGRV